MCPKPGCPSSSLISVPLSFFSPHLCVCGGGYITSVFAFSSSRSPPLSLACSTGDTSNKNNVIITTVTALSTTCMSLLQSAYDIFVDILEVSKWADM